MYSSLYFVEESYEFKSHERELFGSNTIKVSIIVKTYWYAYICWSLRAACKEIMQDIYKVESIHDVWKITLV